MTRDHTRLTTLRRVFIIGVLLSLVGVILTSVANVISGDYLDLVNGLLVLCWIGIANFYQSAFTSCVRWHE